MSWVSPADVIDSWVGGNMPADASKLQVWIDRAERLVRRRIPDLQTRIDLEAELDPPVTDLIDTAKDAVIEMVTEVFKNPDGKRSIQSASGPLSESTTFGGDNPGKLFLSRQQEDLLSGSNPGEAYSVDMIAGHVLPANPFGGWV